MYIYMVTRAFEAPDEINIFSFSVASIFQPSQWFVNIAFCKMATKRHEDEGQNPFSMVFAGDSERHHFQNFFLLTTCILQHHFCNSVAKSLNKSLSTLFFRQTCSACCQSQEKKH